MKKVLLIVLGYILVAGVTFGVTFVAVNNVHKYDDEKCECDCKKENKKTEKKDDDEKVNYKKELKNMCLNVDKDGNYNYDLYEEIEDKLESLEEKEKYDQMWDVVKGLKACNEFDCIIVEDNDSHIYHTYDCENDDYDTEEFEIDDDAKKTMNANVVLSTACSNVNSKGDYSAENVKCENFICDATIDGKTYTRDCTVN